MNVQVNEGTNEQINTENNNQKSEDIKILHNFLFIFMLYCVFHLIIQFIRVYTDYKANPALYSAPYRTWLESLKYDFILYGSAALICMIILIAWKIIRKKQITLA